MKHVQITNIKSSIINKIFDSLSASTRQAYKIDIAQFEEFIGDSILNATVSDILDYFKHLKSKYSNNSINRKINCLSGIYRKLKTVGVIKENPIEQCKAVRKLNLATEKSVTVRITYDDVMKVVNNHTDKRLALIIRVFAESALRISELIHIKHSDIKVNGTVVEIAITGKGNKERTVFLPVHLYQKILDVFGTNSEYLFTNSNKHKYIRGCLYRQIKRGFKRYAGKEHVNPHQLRHLWISHKIDTEKKSIRGVSLYAGHSDIRTTLSQYVHTKLSPADAFIHNFQCVT